MTRRLKADVPRITNAYDALVQALVLALTAPDDARADRASALADSFAVALPETEVARAKAEALATVDALNLEGES